MKSHAVAKALWKLVPESAKPFLLSNRLVREIGTKLVGSTPGTRSRASALQCYESFWQTSLDKATSLIDSGERHIPVIVNSMIQATSWDQMFLKHLHIGEHLENYMLANGIERTRIGSYPKKVVVIDNQYKLVPSEHNSRQTLIDFLANIIMNHSDIDSVVELGSGTGINLFLLHYALPEERRTGLTFFALEPTKSGREVIDRIAGLDQSLELHTGFFDYYVPDFSLFKQKNRNILIFTSHSIEQIPRLTDVFFDKLLAEPRVLCGVHYEPVGWQTHDDLIEARLGDNVNSFERIQSRIPMNLRNNNVSENGAWWSFMNDYNVNLVSLLNRYADEGRLSLEEEIYECNGENPFNPSSLISWKKASTVK